MNTFTDTINPLLCPEWDDIVLSFGAASIFHSRAWAQVLSETYGFKPYGLMLHKYGGPIAAWPVFETPSGWTGKKGVALPFSDHCEPLLCDRTVFNGLFLSLLECARMLKWKTIEFRGARAFLSQYPAAARYNLHVLDLCDDEKQLARRLRSSTRRNIKKAAKQPIKITIETSLSSVKAFYALNCLTRKHHGLPPQPFIFFKKLHEHLLSQGKGVVVLACYRKQMIAGAVFLHYGNCATYKYGASHRDFLSLRPNNLVMWEAIKWYGKRGYRQLDMGRSEPDNRGLNQFKNGWGATVTPMAYYRYDLVQQAFIEGTADIPPLVHRAFRHMPIILLRMLGALAYRRMG